MLEQTTKPDQDEKQSAPKRAKRQHAGQQPGEHTVLAAQEAATAHAVVKTTDKAQTPTEETVEVTVEPLTWETLSDEERKTRQDIYDKHRAHLLDLRKGTYEQFDQAVLTLSSAGLGLSVAFIKDVVPFAHAIWLPALYMSWCMLGGSIISTLCSFVFGRLSHDAAIQYCEEYYLRCKEEFLTKQHWSKRCTDCTNILTGVCFTLGIILTIAFAIGNVHHERNTLSQKKSTNAHKVVEGTPPPPMQKVPRQRIKGEVAKQTDTKNNAIKKVDTDADTDAANTPAAK